MINLSAQELAESLPSWGYPIMLLIMIVEGPIITIVASFLASLGIFNWIVVFLLSMAGDIIGDMLLYGIGFFGGKPILGKAQKILKIKSAIIEKLESRFNKSGAKIIFYVKTTTGLSWITFILAGTVRMPFRKFVLFSFLGGIIWSGFLVALGYFFGYAAEQIEHYIKFAGWIIFAVAILIFAYITSAKKKRADKIISNNDKKS